MSLVDGFQNIRKVLIANRGEIACRIIRSCKQLGLISVVIYSKADRSSSHVRLADEAWLLPGTDQTAYIEEDAVLEIARKSGAHAVIPGYGGWLRHLSSRNFKLSLSTDRNHALHPQAFCQKTTVSQRESNRRV